MTKKGTKQLKHRSATPFVKWTEGKRSILPELLTRVPATFHEYYEPFVGGGALYFALHRRISKAYLSDINQDLITAYQVIKREPRTLVAALQQHQQQHCKEYFYAQRARHHHKSQVAVAARMIYLNRTCFNGLWRVNKQGLFNVPIGSYAHPRICDEVTITACSKALRKATVSCTDYTQIHPKKGDFVYFDPPYHPGTGNSFTVYNKNNFTIKDQTDLAQLCIILHSIGVKVMVSNSDTAFIKSIYPAAVFHITTIQAPHAIGCKSQSRKVVVEAIITNY